MPTVTNKTKVQLFKNIDGSSNPDYESNNLCHFSLREAQERQLRLSSVLNVQKTQTTQAFKGPMCEQSFKGPLQEDHQTSW